MKYIDISCVLSFPYVMNRSDTSATNSMMFSEARMKGLISTCALTRSTCTNDPRAYLDPLSATNAIIAICR